ncbi:MAG: ABC transporter ATP-binding protein [Candidatus Latescibacterota bacterium]|nr:ABC transporter ATP-binding protein [Candidatus Latescibacterota bacterium]
MSLNFFKPFSEYLRPYLRRIVVGLLLLLVAQSITTILPLILKEAIDLARDTLTREQANLDAVLADVGLYAGLIAGLSTVGWAINFGMRWYFTSVSRYVERDLRSAYVHHLLLLPLRFFHERRVGDLMARATNDVEAVQRFLHHGFRMTLMGLLTFFFSLGLMAVIEWQLAIHSLLPMPVMAVTTNFVSSRVRRGYRRIQEQFASMSAHIQENLSGMRVVKAFSRQDREVSDFDVLNQEYVERNRQLAFLESSFYPFTHVLNGVSLCVVLWLGGARVLEGSMSLGAFVAFNAYLLRMSRPMYLLGRMVAEYQRAIASLNRIEAILGEPAEDRYSRSEQQIRGDIEFRDVRVSYDGSPALDDISFHVPAGGTLAIVGRVGSGKSTLARLIPRLMDPDSGQVLIDGMPVGEHSLATLRDAIGYVPQDAFLFSDTLRDNITIGSGSATSDHGEPADAEWAAEISRLSADLQDLPEGLESIVGERGITVSGGQRQRTALARAVIRHPRILILDDALASVDTHTEEEILSHLRGIMASRTTILIAHRLSTVRHADHIIVLDDGRVVEQGTHDALVAADGIYADIHRRQHLATELTEL